MTPCHLALLPAPPGPSAFPPRRFFIQDLYPALVDVKGVVATMERIPLELLTVDIGGDPVPDAVTLEEVLTGPLTQFKTMAV